MKIQTLIVGFVSMDDAAIQRVETCKKEGLCLSCLEPLEPDGRSIRGCHMKCAKATYRSIASGKLTDEGQVEAGEWLPPDKGGRRPSLPVSKKASLVRQQS